MMSSTTHRGLVLAALPLLLMACPPGLDGDGGGDGGMATLEVVNATDPSHFMEAVEVRACGDELAIEVSGPEPEESVLIENLEPGCWQGRAAYPSSECWADWNELGELPAGEVTVWEVQAEQVVDCFGR